MSDEHTEHEPIIPLLEEERESAALEPQQHSTLAHQVAQQLLMASFNKKAKRWGMDVADAVQMAAYLGNEVLAPETLHMHYDRAAKAKGTPNSYHHSIQVKARREAEQAP